MVWSAVRRGGLEPRGAPRSCEEIEVCPQKGFLREIGSQIPLEALVKRFFNGSGSNPRRDPEERAGEGWLACRAWRARSIRAPATSCAPDPSCAVRGCSAPRGRDDAPQREVLGQLVASDEPRQLDQRLMTHVS